MTQERRSFALLVGTLLLLLPALYVGSYYALVEQYLTGPGWHQLHREPRYRYIDCEPVRLLYRPMYQIDRQVRPAYWCDPFYL
jgi:hypothetical protein